MLSKIAGLLKGEIARAAATLVSAQSRFLSLLEAHKATLPGEPEVEAPEVEAPEAEAPEVKAPEVEAASDPTNDDEKE
jgi:hypothetical protein